MTLITQYKEKMEPPTENFMWQHRKKYQIWRLKKAKKRYLTIIITIIMNKLNKELPVGGINYLVRILTLIKRYLKVGKKAACTETKACEGVPKHYNSIDMMVLYKDMKNLVETF